MQPCDSTSIQVVQGFDLKGPSAVSLVVVHPVTVFVVNLLWTQTLLTEWEAKLFLALTLLFSIKEGKNKPKRISDEISNSVNAFQSSVKTLVGFYSSDKTKLGQIILRKVVVTREETESSPLTPLTPPRSHTLNFDKSGTLRTSPHCYLHLFILLIFCLKCVSWRVRPETSLFDIFSIDKLWQSSS